MNRPIDEIEHKIFIDDLNHIRLVNPGKIYT